MQTHGQIDARSFWLAERIVAKIDADHERRGFAAARRTCARWLECAPSGVVAEWAEILQQPWEHVRAVLLRTDDEGRRLRQSSPFCSVLTPRERWELYRRFARESRAA